MAELSRHPQTLEYRSPPPPARPFCDGRWLVLAADAALLSLAVFAIVALLALLRLIILMTAPGNLLFALTW